LASLDYAIFSSDPKDSLAMENIPRLTFVPCVSIFPDPHSIAHSPSGGDEPRGHSRNVLLDKSIDRIYDSIYVLEGKSQQIDLMDN